jgi:hypothetical protein
MSAAKSIANLSVGRIVNQERAVQPQRTQRTQRNAITWEDRPDHLSGEKPLSPQVPCFAIFAVNQLPDLGSRDIRQFLPAAVLDLAV